MAHMPHSTCTIKVGRRSGCGANAHWRNGMPSTSACGHKWLSMHMTARAVLSRDERLTATSGDHLATRLPSSRTQAVTTTLESTIAGHLV